MTNRLGISIDDILDARALLDGEADYLPGRRRRITVRTPLLFSDVLSRRLACGVWLKLESLQTTGSYKLRGAFNTITRLPAERRERGVVTASAGNHAQGVAYAARLFGVAERTTIFVPRGTPTIKKESTLGYGVEVEETGANFDQAREAAYAAAAATGRSFVEPFDDWRTIAGQGTIGVEIIEALPEIDAIVVPVGGGGMIAGVAVAAHALAPHVKIVGVQAQGAHGMVHSLERGHVAALPAPPDTELADGIKVGAPGVRPFHIAQALIGRDRFLTVGDAETIAAVADLLVHCKVVAEGAGAVGVAALGAIQAGRASNLPPFPPAANIAVVVSGGNIDPGFTWRILYERSVPNLLTIRVAIPDQPGELMRLLEPITALNINIVDVDVNRHDARPRMGERVVELCLSIATPGQERTMLAALTDHNYAVTYSKWLPPA